jgi:hypothetical protein
MIITRLYLLNDRVQVVSLEALIANDVGNHTLNGEGPQALISIREGSIAVGTPDSLNGVTCFIKNLAAEILLLRPSTNNDLNSLEGTAGTDRHGLNASTLLECRLRTKLSALVLENDAGLEVGRVGLDEDGVADDLADFALFPEGPFTSAAVGEGDVGVLATDDYDVVTLVVEDLAAEVLALNIFAETKLDGLEGSAGTGGAALLALTLSEGGLRAGLGSLVAEDDGQGVVECCWSERGRNGVGSGERSEED